MVQHWSADWLQANKMEDLMNWLQRGSGLKDLSSIDKRFTFFSFGQHEHDIMEKGWWLKSYSSLPAESVLNQPCPEFAVVVKMQGTQMTVAN